MKFKVKNMLSFLLAMAMLFSISTTAFAAPVGDNLEDILWDWEYYYNDNPDLRVLGRSEAAMRQHYLTFGKNEGRSPSSLFDPKYYLNKYSDLKNAFGSNYAAAYNHFITFGVAEGRQGSASFNVQVYKNNYADLRNVFGTGSADNYKYFKHWREFGQNEHRNAVTAIAGGSNNNTNTSTTTTYYVTTNGANLTVRSGAGTAYSVLGYVANGTMLSVYSISNGWAKITYNGKTGYVSSSYLTTTAPVNNGSVYYKPIQLSGAYFRAKGNDNGWYGYHDVNGVELNTPVYAIADGTVQFCQSYTVIGGVKYLTSYGNHIRFTSSDGKTTAIYAHLNAFVNGVNGSIPSGQTRQQSGGSRTVVATKQVKAGDVLGYIGETGNATGVHLHFELRINGNRVDPTQYIGIPGK